MFSEIEKIIWSTNFKIEKIIWSGGGGDKTKK